MERYRAAIEKRIEQEREFFVDMALRIAENPELGEEEFATSAMLVDALRARGFGVEHPYAGLPTAFNAVKKNGGGPVVVFMAEYDALPEIGHACGHNLSGVMSLLAGIALAEALGDLPGEIRVVGTPAEETNGAKVGMAEKGIFDDVDFAMMAHAKSKTSYPIYRALAIVSVEFDFKGRTSHAAASPWEGLNALNGLQLLFHSLDMLRQHVRPETRIHGVITHGGEAPNIVPDFAQGAFYFRSPSRNYLDRVLEQAYNCAMGAALCTGTEVSWWRDQSAFSEILPNPEVERNMMEVLDELNIPYSDKEHWSGSTDAGNVSWRCPTMHLGLAFTEKEIPLHTREFAAMAADREIIAPKIPQGALAMALMGLRVLTSPDVREKMHRDLREAQKA